ncbi:uncharacterized protein LOC119839325 [Zerene cesonia]|uniref:uncharacterized protein LOC119839325 n=1 Tax=Zerene cesonia TaxID=33412 RepID=UPI0018E584FE|nr:uncharacterized protein LOC119839325 [Zerene cesonia]
MKGLKLRQQSIPESLLQYEHLRDIPTSEVCYERARAGLLVGTDHWEYIVLRELRTGGPNEPAASKTRLGWVVHGTAPQRALIERNNVLHIHVNRERRDQQLHDAVDEHFKIEALCVANKPRVNDNDKRAMSTLQQTIKKTESGYEVGLPWKREGVTMPLSYNTALHRLHGIEKRMDGAPEFAAEYTRQINNLLQKKYAVPCDGTESESAVCWYLPHFAVSNPNKPGKQRLVFDSAAQSHGICLNDELLEGPDLLLPLPGILFRFRERAVAVTADIKEMFLQIKIRAEDQPAQQFLWRGNERNSPPQHYKMTSMIFGAASSPFMAHYVRNHNAQMHADEYPMALEAITNGHYMDDMVVSYNSVEEARRAIKETQIVHAAAGFTLREWSASNEHVLKDIPRELRATTPTQLGGAQQTPKILGLMWDAERDELGFNTSMNRVPAEVRERERPPTKREALSAVMSIYDPLGLLSHYTIRAKIILQSLWRLQLSWDEAIPNEESELFTEWLAQLQQVGQLRLQRCYVKTKVQSVELHVFCDASEQAYAAVAYWRMLQEDGHYSVPIVAAKAKVAPRRTQTIPRLELQAAVMGARLADTIKREHRFEIKRTIYWTDSSTVLHWVRDDTKRYTPFVAHRLGEIAELTTKTEWRWVPTQHNIADDATRINHISVNQQRWFNGPHFLYQAEELWPTTRDVHEDNDVDVFHVNEQPDKYGWLPDPARFSKYETLVRTVARVLAFIDMRVKRTAVRMEYSHVERAERLLMQRAQHDSFWEDIKRLEDARSVNRASKLFRLDPVLEDGILRVRGRINAANTPASMKRPIILDGLHNRRDSSYANSRYPSHYYDTSTCAIYSLERAGVRQKGIKSRALARVNTNTNKNTNTTPTQPKPAFKPAPPTKQNAWVKPPSIVTQAIPSVAAPPPAAPLITIPAVPKPSAEVPQHQDGQAPSSISEGLQNLNIIVGFLRAFDMKEES